MKTKQKIHVLLIMLSLSVLTKQASAQTSQDIEFNLSGDLVSSYVWRGFKQAGASVQPALSVSAKDFTLGVWGSTDIAGKDKKEVDFYASYTKSGFQLKITDYWWDGEGVGRYFSYPEEDYSGHLLEAGVTYTLPERFPLSLSWNTFFLGKGNKKANGDNSFSTYIELAYPFRVNDVDLTVSTGFIPWNSAVYGPEMDGFKFTSIQFGASKDIKITESFSVPLYINVIGNPAREDIHLVLGITIK